MTRVRVSGPARADLAGILATSFDRWGEDGKARYAALLAAAIRDVAARPDGPTTRDRGDLLPGLRSFHVRLVRREHGVNAPVHVVYYRKTRSSIEIVRVLHERMAPSTQLGGSAHRRRAQRK